jgi:hypothetical protein
MIARSLWLLLALVLGFGAPFWAFGLSGLDVVPAVLVSLVGLAGAAWAVRRSQAPRE